MSARPRAKKGGGGGGAFCKLAAAALCAIQVRGSSCKCGAGPHAHSAGGADRAAHGRSSSTCLCITLSGSDAAQVPLSLLVRACSRVRRARRDALRAAGAETHGERVPGQTSMWQRAALAPKHVRPSHLVAAHERWADPSTSAGGVRKLRSLGV
jgi:hypothetical protein